MPFLAPRSGLALVVWRSCWCASACDRSRGTARFGCTSAGRCAGTGLC